MERTICLIPIFFALHNAEEALAFRGRGVRQFVRVPKVFTRLIGIVTERQMLVALYVITAIPFALIAILAWHPGARVALWLLLLTQAVIFLNVFIHIAGARIARGYVPGVVTALAVNLPFSIYLAWYAVRAGWLGPSGIVMCVLVAAVLHGPGLLGLLRLVGYAVNPQGGA